MNTSNAATALALAIVLLAAGHPAAAQQPAQAAPQQNAAQTLAGKLVITGSSTLAPLIADMAQRFQAANPGVTITVEAGGSGRGVEDARSGKADIGMVSRELKRDEKRDLFAITIARDAVAFVVHRDNPVRKITRDQVVAIYEGRLRNWKELGGKDAPIRAFTRTPRHASLEVVSDYSGLRTEEIRGQVVADNPDAVQAVVDDPLALSFVSLGTAVDLAGRGLPIRALAVDGVPATVGELRAGRYPLGRTLSLVTKQIPTGAGMAFIQFVQSPEQRAMIEERDFVPYQ